MNMHSFPAFLSREAFFCTKYVSGTTFEFIQIEILVLSTALTRSILPCFIKYIIFPQIIRSNIDCIIQAALLC